MTIEERVFTSQGVFSYTRRGTKECLGDGEGEHQDFSKMRRKNFLVVARISRSNWGGKPLPKELTSRRKEVAEKLLVRKKKTASANPTAESPCQPTFPFLRWEKRGTPEKKRGPHGRIEEAPPRRGHVVKDNFYTALGGAKVF